MDMAPDRIQLQKMTKGNDETFKECAQRWREVCSQVEPPLSEKEMVTMFIETLQSPFYDNMIGSVSSSFSDLVVIGERVEMGMRSGKIAHNLTVITNTKKEPIGVGKKKEGEAHAVTSTPTPVVQFQTPQVPLTRQQAQNTNGGHKKSGNQEKKFVQFDPIPWPTLSCCLI